MKRTLLFENQELLDFEVDFATCEIRVLDAPGADDALLCSLGFSGPDRDEELVQGMRLFAVQRDYVNEVALRSQTARHPETRNPCKSHDFCNCGILRVHCNALKAVRGFRHGQERI